MTATPASARATVKRNARRAEYDPQVIKQILAAAQICHVAYVVDGEPRQIATLYYVDDDYLYLHGNRQAAVLKHIAGGGEVSVNVMIVDGVVVARSGFHCSMNYRSVTLFGVGEAVPADEHVRVLDQFVDVLVPGHGAAVREHTPQELAATAVVRLPLTEMSAKVRAGDPIDDDGDLDSDVWAGQIPVVSRALPAIPSSDLKQGIQTPDYIANFKFRG